MDSPITSSPAYSITSSHQIGVEASGWDEKEVVQRPECSKYPDTRKQDQQWEKLKADEFRILVLAPSAYQTAPLHGHLETYSLEGVLPSYEFVSYTPYQDLSRRYIYVEGSHIAISSELHSTLRDIRHPFSEVSLWVDAVCVNMEDAREKSHSAREMSRIIRRSRQVNVRFGAEFETSLRFLTRGKGSTSIFWPVDQDASWRWEQLLPFLSHPHFSNPWFLQQIVFARSVTIACGVSILEWSVFEERVGALYEDPMTPDRYRYSGALWFVACSRLPYLYKHLMGHDPRENLGLIIEEFSTWEASDPRDQFFASLAIAKGIHSKNRKLEPEVERELEPDYTKSLLQVARAYNAIRRWGKGQTPDSQLDAWERGHRYRKAINGIKHGRTEAKSSKTSRNDDLRPLGPSGEGSHPLLPLGRPLSEDTVVGDDNDSFLPPKLSPVLSLPAPDKEFGSIAIPPKGYRLHWACVSALP